MKNPSIESLKLHNRNAMNSSLLAKNDNNYNRAKGWYDCLNYITNNYKLEEK